MDAHTLRHLVADSRDVAQSTGGVFGLGGAIAEEEVAALETIARAFGIEEGKSWRDMAADADDHQHGLPPGPRGHFLLGNLPGLLSNPLDTFMQARAHGDVVWIRAPGLRMVLIWRPEHIEHVLLENKDNYVRGRDYEALGRVVGESLLTTDGEKWRKLRRISQPAFHQKHLARESQVGRSVGPIASPSTRFVVGSGGGRAGRAKTATSPGILVQWLDGGHRERTILQSDDRVDSAGQRR